MGGATWTQTSLLTLSFLYCEHAQQTVECFAKLRNAMLLINSVIEHETFTPKDVFPAQESAGSAVTAAWTFRSTGLRRLRPGSLQVPEDFFSGVAGHQEEPS